MNKLESWKAWCGTIPMDATEHSLEKGSHGKAFSFAWDAAVKAEREACAKECDRRSHRIKSIAWLCARAIRARGEI